MRPHGRERRDDPRRAGPGALPGGARARRAAARPGAGQPDRAAGGARGCPRRLCAAGLALRLARALARPRPPPRAAFRPLHPRAGRTRQVDADGPVLRGDRRPGQAPRPFPRLHARGARAPRRATARWRGAGAVGGARRSPDRARLAALLRRVPGPGHRRRDDPRAPVRSPVRARPRGRRDLQLRPRASLRRRPEPGTLRALHRAAARARRGGPARRRHGLPAGAAARRRRPITSRSARRPMRSSSRPSLR